MCCPGFAGAARQMGEAVIVNPFSHEEVSEGLKRALTMGREERIARWRRLMDGVARTDVNIWRDSFVAALLDAHEPELPLFTPQSALVPDDSAPIDFSTSPKESETPATTFADDFPEIYYKNENEPSPPQSYAIQDTTSSLSTTIK